MSGYSLKGRRKGPEKSNNSVVAITDASSGTGRAAARSFVRQPVSVVLAARRERRLPEVTG